MLSSYYDSEARRYDASRGGPARADAAAAAIRELLPESAWTVLDVAGGTGIVGERLGRRVIAVDRSFGMASVAATRLPGHVVLGDATSLPFADGSVDAVTMIWLLHLLPAAVDAIREVARVLRPGGTFVLTVNKADAHYATGDDVGAVLGPAWRATRPEPVDDLSSVTKLADEHGLVCTGETTFVGVGQGRSPARWTSFLRDPSSGWPGRCDVTELCERLGALPDADRPRDDPVYHLVSFTGTISLPSGMSDTGMSLK